MRAIAPGGLLLLLACTRGPVGPAKLDTRNDVCASCRMAVSDARFAAQLVAPGEEPRFFDDLGCVRDWLAANPRLPAGAVIFVADHRTREWVRASRAAYTRCEGVATPMSSHFLAHSGVASRDADPLAAGGVPVGAADLFGPRGPPDGSP